MFLYIVKVQVNERLQNRIELFLLIIFFFNSILFRFKAKLPAPVPVELIVVVVGTLVSYFADFNERYKVAIVGKLAQGYTHIKEKE